MPRVVTMDAATSTVSVFPASIEDNGTEEATITVRVLNTDGNPMAGLAAARITISSTGSGNTIAALSGVTDQNGEISTTMTSTVGATKTISATVCGAAITDTASLVVQTAGGTVATFTDISRDAANTDGGDTVLLTVSSISGSPSVRFNGVLATDITTVNATTISCVVPASLTTGVVEVVCGGVSLTNPRSSIIGGDFEYLPVAGTVMVDADFEGGVLPASLSNSATSGVTVQSGTKYSGTYALQCQLTGAATGGDESFVRNATNVTISDYANGVYVRYYTYFPAATVTNLGDQIKSYLCRVSTGSGQPAWVMTGIGGDFPNPSDSYTSFVDNTILPITGGEATVTPTDAWIEWVQWQKWNGTEGRIKQWINGKLQFDRTDPLLGGTGAYRWRVGIPYVQNRTDTVTVYADEIFAGDGFPNPVVP